VTVPPGPGRDDDARRPDTPAFDASGSAPFRVPDDARELAREAAALRRERSAAARRNRVERVFKTRRWRRYGLSGPLIVLCLLVVSVAGGLLALMVPTRGAGPAAEPLARGNLPPPGSEGGLLPPAQLVVDGRAVPGRELRPALFALLPPECRCPALAASIARQATGAGIRAVFVARPGELGQASALATTAAGGLARAAEDRQDSLRQAYGAQGLTLLVVRADGVTVAVLRDVPSTSAAGVALAPALRRLEFR
jgi:hypothetical protein